MQCVKNNYHQEIHYCYSITSNGNDQLMSWEKNKIIATIPIIEYALYGNSKLWKKKWKYELVFVLHLISIKYIWNPKKAWCAFAIMWSVNLQ
jgi:hypothetical protein